MDETERRLRQAIAQLEAGKGVERELSDEYLERLQSDIDAQIGKTEFRSLKRASWQP